MVIIYFSKISFILLVHNIIFDIFSQKDRNTIILYFFDILKSSLFILKNRIALLLIRLYDNQIFLRYNFKMLLRFKNNIACFVIFDPKNLASRILLFQTCLLYAFLFLFKLCLDIFMGLVFL